MDKQRLLELASALVHAGLTNKDEEILKISEELAAVMGRTESGSGGARHRTATRPLKLLQKR